MRKKKKNPREFENHQELKGKRKNKYMRIRD